MFSILRKCEVLLENQASTRLGIQVLNSKSVERDMMTDKNILLVDES